MIVEQIWLLFNCLCFILSQLAFDELLSLNQGIYLVETAIELSSEGVGDVSHWELREGYTSLHRFIMVR